MAFRRHSIAAAAVLLLIVASVAAAPLAAQDWAGRGRLQGQVTDDQGGPVAGAKVTLQRGGVEGSGPATLTTDSKGRWSVLGLAGGSWEVLIEKEGFVTSEGQVQVNESGGPTPPIVVKLRAAQPQPATAAPAAGPTGNELMSYLENGNNFLKDKKYAEARAEYEKVLPHVPAENQAPVLRGIAATYYEENNLEQATATLKKALELKPDDPALLQLMVNWLVSADREEEAKEYIARLPQGTSVDPNSLLNLGIKAYNEKKLDEAFGYFDRVVRDHADLAEGYYYRGLVELAQNKTAEAKGDFQKLLEIAPDHAKAAEVKEYLEALKTP